MLVLVPSCKVSRIETRCNERYPAAFGGGGRVVSGGAGGAERAAGGGAGKGRGAHPPQFTDSFLDRTERGFTLVHFLAQRKHLSRDTFSGWGVSVTKTAQVEQITGRE